MKKHLYIVLFIVVAVVVSCGNNDPKVYTSISGNWKCEENYSSGGSDRYIVEISKTRSGDYLFINFFNINKISDVDFGVNAMLKDSTLIISTAQQIGNTQTKVLSGSGIVSSDFRRIVFTYKIFDGQNDFEVQAIYSR